MSAVWDIVYWLLLLGFVYLRWLAMSSDGRDGVRRARVGSWVFLLLNNIFEHFLKLDVVRLLLEVHMVDLFYEIFE